MPEVSLEKYVDLLLRKNLRVARVDQCETKEMMDKRIQKMKKQGSTIKPEHKTVKRAITKVYTKGTNTDPNIMVDCTESSFVVSLCEEVGNDEHDLALRFGVCFVDAPTSDFYIGSFTDDRHRLYIYTSIYVHCI